jgi:tRNA 5-methylaminomethyl-2-thiouridine biosynthesis bifunctional protein
MSQKPLPHKEYLSPAEIDWTSGHPRSLQYKDIYYTSDGVAEVNRIYLKPSAILERTDLGDCIQLAELGFGSGLNFVISATEILKKTNKNLHFISFEAHPLDYESWIRISGHRTDFSIYKTMAENPLPLLTGWQRRSFANGRVQLSVYHGDVLTGLKDLVERQRQPVDAWYLDGFAPAKNPQMWDLEVLTEVSKCCVEGSTICAFTAAGAVRRDLQAVGFEMRKVDQQPVKRSSLAGVFKTNGIKKRLSGPKQVSIFGAGIAGCTMARHLADQGIAIQIFEPNRIAAGGSKMDASALHCRLLGDSSAGAEFRARAFQYARNCHQNFSGYRATGAIQLALNAGELKKLQSIASVYAPNPTASANWLQFLDQSTLSREYKLNALGALLFPSAAVIDLPELCRSLIDHPNIELVNRAGKETQEHPFIVACAGASKNYSNTESLEIGEMFGQLDWIKPVTSAHIPIPIVGNGYVIPGAEEWAVGSSYEYDPWPAAQASTSNIDKNRSFLGNAPINCLRYKRAPRCVSSDREPVIGKLDDNAWISTAHGSMGTSSAPIAAAIITSQMLGWVPPVSTRVEESLSAQRFIPRQARRGIKIVGSKDN